MLVVVLHPDLDALSALVGALRARGIETAHATMAAPLLERVAAASHEHGAQGSTVLLVVPEPSDDEGASKDADSLRAALPHAPVIVIPAFRGHAETIVAKTVHAVTSALAVATASVVPSPVAAGEVRGDLAQVALADMLQLLSLGRKTGTLRVTTATAAGEIVLVGGEVVDAIFRRADGMKAVIRLLGEREGGFHFVQDFDGGDRGHEAPALRRIRDSISKILMEGTQIADDIRRLREALGLGASGASVALRVEPGRADRGNAKPNRVIDDLRSFLLVPHSIDEALDELPHDDLTILRGIQGLDAHGELHRIPIGDVRPSLGGAEGMVVLRGLARRLKPRGFGQAVRLALVGSQGAVRLARQATLRLAEAVPSDGVSAESTSDRAIETTAMLQLGESVTLEVVTIIDRADMVAALPMVLAGSVGVIALERLSPTLAALLEELEVAVIDSQRAPTRREEGLPRSDDGPRSADARASISIADVIRNAIEGLGER